MMFKIPIPPTPTGPQAGTHPPGAEAEAQSYELEAVFVRVALFATCVADTVFPDVAEATVRVLARFGCTVEFPAAQICCGQPMYNSGYHDETRRVAKGLIKSLSGYDAIVTPSGSCAAMVRKEWAHLFHGDAQVSEAAAIARRTYEVCEFLVDVLGVHQLERPLGRYEARATVHRSCHMGRLLGLTEQPLALLNRIEGLELIPLPFAEDCCGFGGTFAIKLPEVSTAMADEKCAHIGETGAELLIGADMACLMHLGGRMRRLGQPGVVLHVIQVLDRAMAGTGRRAAQHLSDRASGPGAAQRPGGNAGDQAASA